MLGQSSSLLLLPVLFRYAYAGFGNAFSSGPTAEGNWIRTANSTLIVPKPPIPQVGLLSLWVGMGTSNGDLIQALTESYSGTIDEECGKLNGDWCSWTSTLNGTGQVGAKQVITKVGDRVTMSYVYNDATEQYDQYVLINGEVVSTFATTSGHALGWGTAEECNDAAPAYPCGQVPAHDWVDTVLVLDQPQPDYNKTFGNGGSTGTLTTKDGGKTWRGSRLHINSVNFTPRCPQADGTNFTTEAFSTFKISCGTSFSGKTISKSYPGSLQSCITTCDTTDGCLGVTYQGSACYLKSSLGASSKSGSSTSAQFISKAQD